MLYYPMFFRAFGLRRASQLNTPPVHNLEDLELPRYSILHHIPNSSTDKSISADHLLLRKNKRPIPIKHIVEMTTLEGGARRKSINPALLIREFRNNNKRFRIMVDLNNYNKDPLNIIVYSYDYLEYFYRYLRNKFLNYYKWYNVAHTVWDNINTVANETDRHQFIFMRIPKVLPTMELLQLGEKTINQRIANNFKDNDSLFVLELWKWLGENREKSFLNNLPKDKLDRVNIIMQVGGKWCLINLGLLNYWRLPAKNETVDSDYVPITGYKPQLMQRKFINIIRYLNSFYNDSVDEKILNDEIISIHEIDKTENELTTKEEETDDVNDDVQSKDSDEELIQDEKTNKVYSIKKLTNSGFDSSVTLNDGLGKNSLLQQFNKTPSFDIEKDIIEKEETEVLEETSEQSSTEDEPILNEIIEKVDLFSINSSELNLRENIIKQCKELLEQGLLTPKEYERYVKLSSSYKVLKYPGTDTTLEEYSKTKLEDITLPDAVKIRELKTVSDKSMLESSLLEFDKQYITKVLEKNILSSVLHFQNAGIAVTNFDKEVVTDIMGDSINYTARLVPINGAPSTIRFSLPKITKDGYYVVNGSKYRLKKQVGDIPIRKVAKDKVTLTSYYGKLFVNRSESVRNQYSTWINEIIIQQSLLNDRSKIIDVVPTDCFYNLAKLPRTYTAISTGIKEFKFKNYLFNFDYEGRESFFGKDNIAKYEIEDEVIIGYNEDLNTYISMGLDNKIYSLVNNDKISLGLLEDFLEIGTKSAPIETCEIRVLGKNIPLCVPLCYYLGIETLLESLNITYKKSPSNVRYALEENEYMVKFNDIHLILSKDDVIGSLIFSGFNQFKDIIKTFSFYDFNYKDVYFNLLESKKLGARYLREFDLLDQLFIDNITRDILIQLKEPTEFIKLLIRSVELLMNDQHPDELDANYMRKKGYERFVGVVYSELVKAVRMQRATGGRNKQPIDLNPLATWVAISQDSSTSLLSDINPIQYLKEQEAITFAGTGGRGKRSMVASTRVFHKSDIGVVSESTVDSSSVGINTFSSANPQFSNVWGLSKIEDKKITPTSIFSTSALLSPVSDRDD